MIENLSYLEEQGVSPALLSDIEKFRDKYELDESVRGRVARPQIEFYGREVLEMAISAILQGENLLLAGSKATGKNVLAENLSFIFNRPSYNVSFHVNIDSGSLIGTDTFVDNEVRLRKGPVYNCALYGGFGIFDEINMAKNDAVSVLHSVLDYRRIIDIPGYDKITLHDATRFIGTMNYGYVGTRELNEALVSRFMVIDMPPITEETLMILLKKSYPDAREEALKQFGGLFMDLQEKASNGEITTKPLDLRGMIAAIGTVRCGLKPSLAIRMGIINKSFDTFEKEIVEDIVMTRIPDSLECSDVF
ncbi:MAG: MoxR family ATPase [Lachnospiraceae bacterium]|nr:MoxR family ATPase [Lachnospiraceae bacterium]MBR4806944.1 MoxR family ATPase [Lachnospiraceae bacterium]